MLFNSLIYLLFSSSVTLRRDYFIQFNSIAILALQYSITLHIISLIMCSGDISPPPENTPYFPSPRPPNSLHSFSYEVDWGLRRGEKGRGGRGGGPAGPRRGPSPLVSWEVFFIYIILQGGGVTAYFQFIYNRPGFHIFRRGSQV